MKRTTNYVNVQILSGHKGCVRDVSWHPYNQEILSSSWDFTVRRWVTPAETSDDRNTQRDSRGGCEKKRRLDLRPEDQ